MYIAARHFCESATMLTSEPSLFLLSTCPAEHAPRRDLLDTSSRVITPGDLVGTGFNKDKKKKPADLLAKRKAAATGANLSTPLTPSSSAALASQPINLARAAVELRGAVAIESDDEDTCPGLVFKRPRVGMTMAPSASASAGTLTFMHHPPCASSPLQVVSLEGGGESAPGGQETPSSSPLPLLLQKVFSRFQSQEWKG